MTKAWSRMATLTVSTKRSPAPSADKIGSPTTHLTGVKVLPIMPAGAEAMRRFGIETLLDMFVTFTAVHAHTDDGSAVTQLPDIVPGDILVDGATEYAIEQVLSWPATHTTDAFMQILLRRTAD